MKNMTKIWNLLMNHQFYRTVNLVIFIFYFVPSDFGVDYYPYVLSFFWGIVLLAWDFFTERLMFKQHYWYMLLALCISYGLSIVTNLSASIPHIGMNFIYLALSVFVFYVINPDEKREDRNLRFEKMNDFFIVIMFVLSIISLVTFIFNISFLTAEGARQGFIENRLFGVFTSPNMGSMFGFITIILILVNNYFKRGSWKKFQTFYIVNAILQYLYFVLSSSRGTQLTLIAFFVFIFLITSINLLTKRQRNVKIILRNAVLLVGALTIMTKANDFTSLGLSYVPSIINNVALSTNITETETPKKNDDKKSTIKQVEISHSDENSEVSSGRYSIWDAGIQLVKQKPVFGVADSYVYRSGKLADNIDEEPLSKVNKSELNRAEGNMHNTYVAILVKAGISGFLILFVFIVFILKDNYLFIIDERNKLDDEAFQVYIILLAFLLSLFTNDIVENHLIFNNRDVMGLIFWSYLSFLNHYRTQSFKMV